MSETYVPRPGDRVRFYSWAAQMDLHGEVLVIAPQARMATVRVDDEDGETYMKSWDVLRLDEPAPAGLALITRLRDERDEAIRRADELQVQIDAFPYETGAPVGDKVAARIAEYRERVRQAEAHALKAETDLQATRGELARQANRAEKAEAELAAHRATHWTDHDGTVRPIVGTPAQLSLQLYDENERAGQEKARADKLAAELAELKAALATLAGAAIVPTQLP